MTAILQHKEGKDRDDKEVHNVSSCPADTLPKLRHEFQYFVLHLIEAVPVDNSCPQWQTERLPIDESLPELWTPNLLPEGMAFTEYRRAQQKEACHKDPSQWTEAVNLLQAAEKEDASLALVKANLGLALLVQPTGSDPKRALTYLIPAVPLLHDDRSLHSAYGDMAVTAVFNNLAVAYLAAGDRADALQILQVPFSHQTPAADEQSRLQVLALYYNAGMALSTSGDARDLRLAAHLLHQYLEAEAPASIWWKQAYAQYAKVCSFGPDGCSDEMHLKAANHVPIRETAAVDLGAGKSIRLGEPFQQVATQIGEGQQVGSIPNSSVQRLRYPKHSLDIVSTDVVLAIILRAKNSPSLRIRQMGTDSGESLIHCGMTTDELEAVLRDQPYRYEGLLDTWVPYRFYPTVGIAVRVGPQKTVEEVVLVSSERGS